MTVANNATDLIVSKQSAFRATPGGGIVVNLQTGASFELNTMGAEVWRLLVDGSTVAEISARLHSKFAVAPQTVTEDVGRICADMLAAGLIESRS